MDAMIFAAGLGTRLGALTERTPKALIEVGGITMLERIARRLAAAGAVRIIVNVHHHADLIERFIEAHNGFGIEMPVSREDAAPLETGGGLLHAAHLFHGDRPILLHNADIITDVDLERLRDAHAASGALATLAVSERETSRYLLFDDEGLFGRIDLRTDVRIECRPRRGPERCYAFAGIHAVAPDLPSRFTETGACSILEPYLRLAGAGETILPYPIGDALWLEIGTPERLEAARRALERERSGAE